MGKFDHILFTSDFDFTLTDRTGHIPQSNLDAIVFFMEQGGAFTINTGRSLAQCVNRFRSIPMNAPLLFCNGAGAYDLQTGQVLFCHMLPPDAKAMMQRFAAANPDLRLEAHSLEKNHIFNSDQRREDYLIRQGAAFEYGNWDTLPEPCVKFAIYSHAHIDSGDADEQRFARLRQEVEACGGGRYAATHSLPGLVEVQTAGFSKATGARELAALLNRSVIVCAGDAPNDLEMLEDADHAFLAGDCYPQMLNRGFTMAAPCAEGTVADVIRRLDGMF